MRIATFATALLAGLALAAPVGAAPASAAPPANTPTTVAPAVITEDGLCDVVATIAGQWATGYVANISIRNISAFPVTWRASLTLPSSAAFITSGWGVTITQTGSQVQFLPPPWGPYPGGLLQPGQTHNFGFAASGTGTVVLPKVVCSRAG
jgi:Cellulose binding domain